MMSRVILLTLFVIHASARNFNLMRSLRRSPVAVSPLGDVGYVQKCSSYSDDLLRLDAKYTNPITFPGPFELVYDGALLSSLNRTLSLDLIWKVKVASYWVKMPCILNLGSCHYDNICEFLDYLMGRLGSCEDLPHAFNGTMSTDLHKWSIAFLDLTSRFEFSISEKEKILACYYADVTLKA